MVTVTDAADQEPVWLRQDPSWQLTPRLEGRSATVDPFDLE